MELLISWILVILILLILFVIALSLIQFRKIKNLKLKINSLEEAVDIPKEKYIDIDLKLFEKKILSGTDSELTKYAQQIYIEKDSMPIKTKFEKLIMLDKKVIDYALIRLDVLEDFYDLSKFLPPLVVFLLAALATYNGFFQELFFKSIPLLHFGFPLVVIIGSFLYIAIHVGETRWKKSSIIFIKCLLNYAKEQKKES
ncbi:hypothetical protein GI482_09030 [Bacillus sp. N3536]|nr:hypothetical protein GI482_09030 [Bacillus sp. N3536]